MVGGIWYYLEVGICSALLGMELDMTFGWRSLDMS